MPSALAATTKAQDRAARAVNEVRGKAAAAGRFQSGATAIHSIERARFSKAVELALFYDAKLDVAAMA